jgi:hypothetical protein
VIIEVRDPGERTHARNTNYSYARPSGDCCGPVVGLSSLTKVHRIAANIAKLPELFSILSLLVATALAPQPAQEQINGEPRNEDGNSTSGHDGRVEDVRIYAERLAQFLVPKVAVGNIWA